MGVVTLTTTKTNNSHGQYQLPTNPGLVYTRRAQYMLEVVSVTTAHRSWQRGTGAATPTAQTPEKLNTRTASPAGTYAKTMTTDQTNSGNPLVYVCTGEQTFCCHPMYAFCRPWALPVLLDTEQAQWHLAANPGAGVVSSMTDVVSEDVPSAGARRHSRRPTRRGMWHTYRHRTQNTAGTAITPSLDSPMIWYAPVIGDMRHRVGDSIYFPAGVAPTLILRTLMGVGL